MIAWSLSVCLSVCACICCSAAWYAKIIPLSGGCTTVRYGTCLSQNCFSVILCLVSMHI